MLMLLLAFNLLCGGAAVLGEGLLSISNTTSMNIVVELLNSVAYIAAFSIPVWFFLVISKKNFVQPFGVSLSLSTETPALISASMMFLGTSACFAASYINSLMFPIAQETSDICFSGTAQAPYVVVLMFISTAIIPAFVEELLFRGVVLSSIRPYSEGGAILISAILFGFMHQTPFQLFYATAIGVILGIIRVQTGSIWIGVLVHFFNNFLSVIQTYLLGCFDDQTGTVIYTILTLSVMALGGLLGAALYMKSASQKKGNTIDRLGFFGRSNRCSSNISFHKEKSRIFKAFFCPAIVAFLSVCALAMFFSSQF